MSVRLILMLVAIIFENILAERDAPCTTPNGESATCVPLSTCEIIVNAASTANPKAIEFAKKSQCDYDKTAKEAFVCCGSSGFSNNYKFDISSVFTEEPPSQAQEDTIVCCSSLNSTNVITTESKTQGEEEAVILVDFGTSELPDRSICGLQRETSRVIGGILTELEEFPWSAGLVYKSLKTGEDAGIRCGGSIINSKYILTAAHCITDSDYELTGVRLGEWNITEDPDCINTKTPNEECADPVQNFKIKNKIPHPLYSALKKTNDIGLLKLENDITYSEYIRPICLPPINLPSPKGGTSMIVAGWGKNKNGTSSNIKLKGEIPFLPITTCQQEPKMVKIEVTAHQQCAGSKQGQDPCQMDPGSPIMRIYEDPLFEEYQWFLEGVVSWNVECGRSGHPVVYTLVSRYINWIINIIKEK